MKVAIVGGGWYGCHIATALAARGIEFTLFEAQPRLLNGASGYNQNRLHLGFHYPRSAATRLQSKQGFAEFQERYGHLSAPVADNIYAVCEGDSLLDFETYRMVMEASGLAARPCSPLCFGLRNVTGAVKCDERTILTSRAREWFTDLLGANAVTSTKFVRPMETDFAFVVNCTYQTWTPVFHGLLYEPCVTLLYQSEKRQAITLMDGPFYSIYPTEDGLSTLYSVAHSRLMRTPNLFQASERLRWVNDRNVEPLRKQCEKELRHWYPAFADEYRYDGWYGSMRAIRKSSCDERACEVTRVGNVIHVLPGKIDAMFHAEREVFKCLALS